METVFALPRESDRDGGRKEGRAKELWWQPHSSGGRGGGAAVEQGHFSFRTIQCQAGVRRLDPSGKASCS